MLAGGPGESVVQPVWGADLALWFFSDRTDFWSLYRKRPHEEPELVVDVGSDIAGPQWVFGQSRFALLADGRVVVRLRPGRRRPARRPRGRTAASASSTCRSAAFRCLDGAGDARWSASPAARRSEPVVLRVDVDGGEPEILRPARDLGLDPAWFSRPEHVTFPTADGGTGHRRRARAGLPADQPRRARPRTASCRR